MRYLANEDQNSGKTIIAKNNEAAEYPYISICGSMAIDDTRLECCQHIIKVQ